MIAQIGMSRRRALEMAVAVGGLAMSGGSGRAQTPPQPKIEQLAAELEKVISPSEPIQSLADGFGGTLGPAEGPLWWKEGKYLLFSDIHNNKRMKYDPGTKNMSVFLEANQPGQRPYPRPPRPPARLRARHAAGDAPGT